MKLSHNLLWIVTGKSKIHSCNLNLRVGLKIVTIEVMDMEDTKQSTHAIYPGELEQKGATAPSPEDKEEQILDQYDAVNYDTCVAAGKEFSMPKNPFKKNERKKSDGLYSFGQYDVKPNNHKKFGKSVVCVIANFTGEMLGYNIDVKNITKFHREFWCVSMYLRGHLMAYP